VWPGVAWPGACWAGPAALRRPGGLLPAPSLAGGLVGTAIARVATRSVPGAILVGGGLVAKALYERRKSRRAARAATITPRKPR
jgi:hypothetical protein